MYVIGAGAAYGFVQGEPTNDTHLAYTYTFDKQQAKRFGTASEALQFVERTRHHHMGWHASLVLLEAHLTPSEPVVTIGGEV